MTNLDGVARGVAATAPARSTRSRSLVGLGVLAALVAAGVTYGVLREPAPAGLAGTGWEPAVILAVDSASPEWEFRSLHHGGDVVPSRLGHPDLDQPYREYRLSYTDDPGFAAHSRSLAVQVFEVSHSTSAAPADERRSTPVEHEPAIVRGHPATTTVEAGGNPVATVEWWEDGTTMVRVTLMGVPSLAGLAASDELLSPTADDVVAAADALVEISNDDWLELDRQTQERRAAAATTDETPPAAGPVTTMIGRPGVD